MGIAVALLIIMCWASHLFYILGKQDISFSDPLLYFHILVQTYLFTGIFITSHDAMHKNICKSKFVNNSFGYLTSFLFAGFSFKKLLKSHLMHHSSPTSEDDPDFNPRSQNFVLWWFKFLSNYVSIFQLVTMAILFNILTLFYSNAGVILFWVIPSILSTLQLFYFGTYLPHRNPDEGLHSPHFARSQKKNHFWAMLSCYFFGYHHEHHSSPKTPWWRLYKISEN